MVYREREDRLERITSIISQLRTRALCNGAAIGITAGGAAYTSISGDLKAVLPSIGSAVFAWGLGYLHTQGRSVKSLDSELQELLKKE